MISTTQYQNLFAQHIQNTNSSLTALGLTLINQSLRYLTGKFYPNERSYSTYTKANQQFYAIPPQAKQLITLTVQIGTVIWTPKPCPSREYWDALNVIPYQQDVPQYYFVYGNNQVGIWPTPASSDNTIAMNYKIKTIDLSQADYTTGTIITPYTTTFTGTVASGATSATLNVVWPLTTGSYQIIFSDGEIRYVTLTNGSAAVSWTSALTASVTATITVNTSTGGSLIIGSGTTFNYNMVNRWIQITAPTGDNQWYQILNYYSTTQIGLYNPYTGTAVSGAAFTIGEMPLLPEEYQDLALYRALMIYWTSIVPDKSKALIFKGQYDQGYQMLEEEYGQKTTSPVLEGNEAPLYNPNLFQRNVTGSYATP